MNLLFSNDRHGEYPPSWYAATVDPLAPFPELHGAERADICVVGAGYTGLSAALHLAQAGADVILLEAHRVGFGASGRNGGQVGQGQRVDQIVLEKRHGMDKARALWAVASAAVQLVRDLIAAHHIPARWCDGILYADCHARDVAGTHVYAEHLARNYGYDGMTPLDRDGLRAIVKTDAYQGGALDRGSGHVHPLAFALGLARAAKVAGVRIFEKSHALHLNFGSRPIVRTGKGHVMCDQMIVAANGYLGTLVRGVPRKVMPINNFIVATEPLPEGAVLTRNVAVADSRFVVNYFRMSHDNRLLFGGGESYGYRFPADIGAVVAKPMRRIFPQLRNTALDYAWGGTLAITMSRMPHFARLAPNVLSASGYSGHGLALATLAGRIMAEALRGETGRFDLMAHLPNPDFPGGGVLRAPLLALAMSWYAMRDRLGL
ncbi:MAG: FAD-binding oxidoreductase [Pseudomonadota bacterium]